MKHIYSHIFKFETIDFYDLKQVNNIISIIEEDSKKHFINLIEYHQNNGSNVHSREVNIKVDRHYYLEIANISIDNIERKNRLFTIMGKRCFGINNNKLDCYFIDKDLDSKNIYSCYEKYKSDERSHPILHELITHTVNKYEAYPFYCTNGYFAVLKQTNISKRKTFEKTFLVQMKKADHTKLLTYQTNELKIEFIFNLIGRVYFAGQALVEKTNDEVEYNAELVIDKRLEEISEGSITNQTFLNLELFSSLKENTIEIENAYFNFLSRGLEFINEPDNEEIIFLFSNSISSAVKLIKDEELFEEIISFLEMLKIIVKEKKISYLISKNDQDIQDIFLFLLETMTVWHTTLNEDNLVDFNGATIDLYNALKYFIDTYFKFYYDYQSKDAQVQELEITPSTELKKNNVISAKEFLIDIDLDYAVLDELLELEVELENSLYSTDIFNELIKKVTTEFLYGYIRMLNTFYEFQDLAYALSLLSDQIEKVDADKNNIQMLLFFKTIIDDLIQWKVSVFIDQSAKDIHSIDESFYVNVAQIDILLKGDENMGNEIEFF